ncbi:MAG: redox-sensing transcriptional repressor Rex [Pirellulaceae bacterium]
MMSNSRPRPPSDTPPKAVIHRLCLYLREMQHLIRDGSETISSTQLGRLLGLTDAQVRKDLAHFGQFGYPGIGYRCGELVQEIKCILGTNQAWPVAIVGMGHLGQALVGYRGFEQQGFQVTVAFDIDPDKTGRTMHGVEVHHLSSIERVAREQSIRLAILAVPAAAAQEVAEVIIAAGIEGVLNFAPVTLTLPETVHRVGVDLAMELEQLSFAVVNRTQKS